MLRSLFITLIFFTSLQVSASDRIHDSSALYPRLSADIILNDKSFAPYTDGVAAGLMAINDYYGMSNRPLFCPPDKMNIDGNVIVNATKTYIKVHKYNENDSSQNPYAVSNIDKMDFTLIAVYGMRKIFPCNKSVTYDKNMMRIFPHFRSSFISDEYNKGNEQIIQFVNGIAAGIVVLEHFAVTNFIPSNSEPSAPYNFSIFCTPSLMTIDGSVILNSVTQSISNQKNGKNSSNIDYINLDFAPAAILAMKNVFPCRTLSPDEIQTPRMIE